MKKRPLVLTLILIAILFSKNALAGSWCIGPVTNLGVTASGTVFVFQTKGFFYVNICNIETTMGSVTANVCKIWYDKLNAAYLTGRNVSFDFAESSTDCTQGHPAGGNLAFPVIAIESL